MIYYSIQVFAFQAIFLLAYDALLRKETFFSFNRAYLLFTSFISLIVPLIKLDSLRTSLPTAYIFQLPAVIIGEQSPTRIASINTFTQHISENGFVWRWQYLIYIGMVCAALILFVKLRKLILLCLKNESRRMKNFRLVELKKSNEAFSFFNLIFLGEHIREEDRQAILNHEMVHLKLGHSYDLVWMELLRIGLWFNPMTYLYHKRLMEQHEFAADKHCLNADLKSAYYHTLLNRLFKTNNLSFVNHFYKKSLIKKRIVMLNRKNSKRKNLLKYAFIIPITLCMLFIVSCENEAIENDMSNEPLSIQIEKLKTTLESSDELSEQDRRDLEKVIVEALRKNEKQKIKNSYNSHIDKETIPYAVIEQAPLFEGCDPNLPNKDKRICTSQSIGKFVNENFNTDLANSLGLTGRQRINVIFKIDENGNVIEIRSRAPHPELEKEAARVVSLLPKFVPGIQDGKKMTVPYSLPIVFQVSD